MSSRATFIFAHYRYREFLCRFCIPRRAVRWPQGTPDTVLLTGQQRTAPPSDEQILLNLLFGGSHSSLVALSRLLIGWLSANQPMGGGVGPGIFPQPGSLHKWTKPGLCGPHCRPSSSWGLAGPSSHPGNPVRQNIPHLHISWLSLMSFQARDVLPGLMFVFLSQNVWLMRKRMRNSDKKLLAAEPCSSINLHYLFLLPARTQVKTNTAATTELPFSLIIGGWDIDKALSFGNWNDTLSLKSTSRIIALHRTVIRQKQNKLIEFVLWENRTKVVLCDLWSKDNARKNTTKS